MDVVLRPLRVSDARARLQWMNDDESVRYLGSGFLRKKTLDEVREEILLRLDGEFTGEECVIADAVTQAYLGQINLMHPDEQAKCAALSLVLLPSARGKGLAKKALKLFLKKAFEEWGYHRLYLKCAARNERAVKLYESAGFVHEGTLRAHMMTSEGLTDVKLYGMLREDWQRLENLAKGG